MKHKNFNSIYPYAYYLVRKSDNKKYVGIRYANVKSNLTPNQDFGKVYFTSGSFRKEFKNNPNNFYYRIVYTFDSIEDAFDWEKKVVMRIYKKESWANNGWARNFGDNPEIGKLISSGKTKLSKSGKTSIEVGAEKLIDWIWNTPEGKQYRKNISEAAKDRWSSYSEEEKKKISEKRKSKMDFKKSAIKTSEFRKNDIVDGKNSFERGASKGVETKRNTGKLSEAASKRNERFNIKLGEMSEEEFKSFCEGKSENHVRGWSTRRKRYLAQKEVTILS